MSQTQEKMNYADSASDDILARAQALADCGDFVSAIAVASQRNRQHRSDALEIRIAEWRHQAFLHQTTPSPRTEWPPSVPDPFPGCRGIPEISAPALDSRMLAGGILHHGCLLVRGLLDGSDAQRLAAGIDASLAAAQEPQAEPDAWHSPFPTPADSRLGQPGSRSFGARAQSMWTADSPRMLFDLIELFESLRVTDMIGEYLGERPALSVGKSALRRVSPTLSATAWHQDGAFLGADVRSVNLWLSLSHCGEDASAMDVVPKRITRVLETGTDNAPLTWCIGDAKVSEAAQGTPVASPIFAPGDALLFDHFFVHRTSLPPGRCRDRYAIESWFFAPTGYPMEQMPLWV